MMIWKCLKAQKDCTSSYSTRVLSFIALNVTVEGEEGDVRPVQPDLLRSGGLRDYTGPQRC